MTEIFGVDWSIIVSIAVLFFGLVGYTVIIPWMTYRRVRPLLNTIMPEIEGRVRSLIASEFSQEKMQETMKQQVPVIISAVEEYVKSDDGRTKINSFLVNSLPELLNAELVLENGSKAPVMAYIAGIVGGTATKHIDMYLLGLKKQVGDTIQKSAGAASIIPDILHAVVPKKYHGAADAIIGEIVAKHLRQGGGVDGNGGSIPPYR